MHFFGAFLIEECFYKMLNINNKILKLGLTQSEVFLNLNAVS